MTQLIRGLYNLKPCHQKAIVTIGNFDGVHKGHQALIKYAIDRAKALGGPSVLITFEPQPLEFFKKSVARLTRWQEKWIELNQSGIDYVLVLRFDAQLAALPAVEFVEHILVKGLAVQEVIVGHDFRFGAERLGDCQLLAQIGEKKGFSVTRLADVLVDGERVSSTRIRKALQAAEHDVAGRLLGRPYSMLGRVVHGDKLGRELGFPTANIHVHRPITPVQGIYSVRMHGLTDHPLPGVANVGVRPTVGGTRNLLEVYLFDFDQDIYGRRVQVEFCEKIRDEEYYETFALLKTAIANDVTKARAYFRKRGEL